MASADHISQSHDSQSPQDEPIVRGRLLDGFLLLASGGFMLPDEAVRVNLSSLEIVEVSDDLRFFHNLDSLDLSDNFLNYSGVLEHIFVTPRLSSLNLSCNQIATLTCNPNPVQYPSAFHALTQLDLSFNELHGDILMTLAPLPKLEKLNLTANCISSIPPEEALVGFNCLQELVLDSNDLVQLDQWRSLDCLPKLRVLGLAANRIRRLKSEASEQAMAVGGGEQERRTFFETLEEMDLRSNDFVSLDALGLLHELPSLKKILVSISVSDKQKNSAPFRIQTQRQEAFYMAGNGSHMAQRKKQHRKSERSKRNYFMRVSSKRPDHLPSLRQTMGKFSEMSDEELQRVLFAEGFGELRGAGPEDFEEPPVDSPYKLPALDLINEHLSDADMDAMFKQRRAQIDDLVRDKCAQEPTRQFLKPIPFSLSDQMVRIIQQHSTDDGEGAGKAFLTQQDGDVENFFHRFTEKELVSTPRTPPEVKQQKLAQEQKNQTKSAVAAQSGIPAVDVPIDVKRSLAALREAMDGGGTNY